MVNVIKKNDKKVKLKSTFRKKNKNLRTSSIKHIKSKVKKKQVKKKQSKIKLKGGSDKKLELLRSKQLKISNTNKKEEDKPNDTNVMPGDLSPESVENLSNTLNENVIEPKEEEKSKEPEKEQEPEKEDSKEEESNEDDKKTGFKKLKSTEGFVDNVIKLKKSPNPLEQLNKSWNEELPIKVKESMINDGFDFKKLYDKKITIAVRVSKEEKRAKSIDDKFIEIYKEKDARDGLIESLKDYQENTTRIKKEKKEEKPQQESEKANEPEQESETKSKKHHHHKTRKGKDGQELPKLKDGEHYVKHHKGKENEYYSIENENEKKTKKDKDGNKLRKLEEGEHYIHHKDGTYSIEKYENPKEEPIAGGGQNTEYNNKMSEIIKRIEDKIQNHVKDTSKEEKSTSDESEKKPENLVDAINNVAEKIDDDNKNKNPLTSALGALGEEDKKVEKKNCPPPPDQQTIEITLPKGSNVSTNNPTNMDDKMVNIKAKLSEKPSAPYAEQQGGKKGTKKYRRFKLRKRTRRRNRLLNKKN